MARLDTLWRLFRRDNRKQFKCLQFWNLNYTEKKNNFQWPFVALLASTGREQTCGNTNWLLQTPQTLLTGTVPILE